MALSFMCDIHGIGYVVGDLYPAWWCEANVPKCPRCRLDWLREHKDAWDFPVSYEILEAGTFALMESAYKFRFMGSGSCDKALKGVTKEQAVLDVAVSPRTRWTVFNRDGFCCFYCGRSSKEGATLHVDHVVPQALGGGHHISNLITACEQCNLGKSSSQCLDEESVLAAIDLRNRVANL